MRLVGQLLLRGAALAILVTAGALALGAPPAAAHASLVSTAPTDGARLAAGPTTVVLTFNESVSVTGDSIRVLGTDGERVDDGRPRVDGHAVSIDVASSLPEDTYIVSFRVVSADDHPIRGATTFVVGDGPRASDATIAGVLGDDGDGPWPVLGAIARGMAYLGGLLVIGAVAWSAFVEHGALTGETRRVATIASIGGGIGVLLTVPIQAALTTGLGLDAVFDTEVLGDVLTGPLGLGVLLVLLGFGAVAVGRPWAMAGAVLVGIGFARSGHTETTDPTAVMSGVDLVHLVAAGTWLGGLVLLAIELRDAARGTVTPAHAVAHVDRFSRLAAIVSLITGTAGVVLAWGTVRSFDALTSTTYGATLLVKVAFVAAVGGVASYNHWKLVPAVLAGGERARVLLARTMRFEVLGLVAALAVTAALVNIEPARLAANPGLFEATVPFGSSTAVVQVDPARAGDNAVHIYLLDDTGRAVDLDEAPAFAFSFPAADVGPIERTPWRAGPGHYTYDGPELARPGTWTLVVTARVSTFDEATASVDIPIR